MSCSSCNHFLVGVFSLAANDPAQKWQSAPDGHGICRRYPPRFVPEPNAEETVSLFPSVHADQHCGEFNSRVPL